jgi:xanthine dehydrogenase YagT iron-sulfur-binding subunit
MTMSLIGSASAEGAAHGAGVSPGFQVHTTLRINGCRLSVAQDIRASLRDTLGESLGLAAAGRNCEHGECGACIVRIDGKPTLSCQTLTIAAEGHDITTIEGLTRS